MQVTGENLAQSTSTTTSPHID